jgi:hypothetical protein
MTKFIVMKVSVDPKDSEETITKEIAQSAYLGGAYAEIMVDYPKDAHSSHYEIWEDNFGAHGEKSLVTEVYSGEIETMLIIKTRG